MTESTRAVPPPPEERHPLSQRVREIALSLPNAREDHPWGDVVFKVGEKLFLGCHVHSGGITVKANPGELPALLERPNIVLAPYVGRFGWVQMTFDSEAELPFVEQLIRMSYELVASRHASKKAGRKKASAP